MQANSPLSLGRILALIIMPLALAGCLGEGDGPTPIPGNPAPPPPPPGFCDAINFEDICGEINFVNFGGGVAEVIDNPDPRGINPSDRVARMRKFAGEVFGGSQIVLRSPVDFGEGEAFTMKVWSPREVPVTFKLEGLNQERAVSHSGGGAWEELCFEFAGSTSGPAATGISVIFDLGVVGAAGTDPFNWTFFFDDITQVDTCGGAPVVLPVDFEGGPYRFSDFEGGVAAVVSNPDASGINTSPRAARMQKFEGATFAGSTLNLDSAVDFGAGAAFTMKVWSRREVPVLFKFEGLNVERTVSHPGGGQWQELCFDFAGSTAGPATSAITFIFDNGVPGAAATDPNNWTFFIDDIVQVASCGGGGGGAASFPVDFEGAGPFVFSDFEGGVGAVVDNPDASGLNTSARVARMQKFAGAVFAGSTLSLGGAVDFAPGQAFTMKVWSTREVPVLFKFEGLDAERTATHPGGSSWQELCFDFTGSTTGAATSAITFIFDLGVAGAAETDPDNWTFFLDDITQVSSCGGAGADPGIIPDVVIFASDPAVPVDLVFGVDYTGFDPFGSGSVFDNNNTTDADFNPAFGVTTGDGYGAQVGQFAIVGFQSGFASMYETLDFKAKGLNNDLIRVKFLDDGEYVDIVLTGSAFSTPLGNDWYQVSIPLSSFTGVETATALLFETDNTASSAFTFLLTDFGFSGSGGPANSPNSIIPANVIFATDPTVPVDFVFGVDYTGFEPFGSGSVFNTAFADDPGFNPVISITSGAGYGANVAQFAIVGFQPGFAAGFGTLQFKIKGIPDNLVRLKFLDDGEYLDIDLLTSQYVAPLGSDWYQVSIPLSEFTGVDTATALLFESNNTSPTQFTFLLTDVGFGDAMPAAPGIVPDVVIFSSSASPDLVFGVDYTGFDPFGSGSVFDNNITTDPDFSPAFGVTTGAGYGAQVGQFAIVGFQPGFASGYESLVFKAKNLNNDLIRVRFLDDGQYLDITLTSSPYSTALGNGWFQVVVPLADVTGVATATTLLFETDNTAAAAFTFLLTDFGFNNAGPADGNIAVNGGFETGDFSGWQQFAGGATQAITDVNPASGTYAANLAIPVLGPGAVPVDNLIKNANLEAGNLTPGASVTVSFAMRGSLTGAGGVVFAELFSELAGGGVSKAEILGGGPLNPVDSWTNLSFDTTLGPDVQGGVTLQLKVGCGGVEGCGADVYFDDVSIVVN